MSIVKFTEISSSSTESFEDAISNGIARAAETVRGIKSAWVNEQTVKVEGDKVAEYRVNLRVGFVLDK